MELGRGRGTDKCHGPGGHFPHAASGALRALLGPFRRPQRNPNAITDLMNAGRARYLTDGDATPLDKGIDRGRRELKRGGSRTPEFHAALAGLFQARYQHGGDPADVEEALHHIRTALKRAGTAAPGQRSVLRSNLAFTLRSRFEVTGDPADLDEALDLARRAHSEAPLEQQPQITYMLSTILGARYSRLGDSADLTAARTLAAEVVAHTPEEHPEYAGYLANLAIMEMLVHRRTGDVRALDRASRHYEDLIDRLDTVSAIRPVVVANWSLTLGAGSDYLDPAQWLEPGAASATPASYLRLARRMLPEVQAAARQAEGTAYWPSAMAGVARTFLTIYAADRRVEDLRSAIAAAEAAVRGAPAEHADHADARMAAAAVRMAAAVRDGDFEDIAAVESHLLAIVHQQTARPPMRVRAARVLAAIRMARQDPAGALAALRVAIGLLPLLAWPGTSRPDQEFRLAAAAGVGREAAAAALSQGLPDVAVEVGEAGRAVLWSGLLDRRADLAGLAAVAPELAHALARLAGRGGRSAVEG